MTKVRLNRDVRSIERTLREVAESVKAESPPTLILNDHCQICEFRQRCHEQAVREDSISLLRGISENEVKRFARKGLFTVTQLAHTFRPRRKGKRKGRQFSITPWFVMRAGGRLQSAAGRRWGRATVADR
jgi:predicted RecB family nuclease